jgi:hypothetical protein
MSGLSSAELSLSNPILTNQVKIDKPKLQKMIFIMNALEKGWSVKKSGESYIFIKKHENRKEIFMESYLEKFILSNIELE